MRIKFDCGIKEFEKMKNEIEHCIKNGLCFEFCGVKHWIRSFDYGKSHDTVKAEVEMYKIKEAEINEGDYVSTDKFIELDSNTIYKVCMVVNTGIYRFVQLHGCGEVKFKADLFKKVEVK